MLWQFGILAAVLVFGIKLGLAVGLANLSKKYLATVCLGYGAGVLILAEISSHFASEITDLIYAYNSLFFIILKEYSNINVLIPYKTVWESKGDRNMPLVRIEMLKGKSPEYKKSLLDCVHAGLIESLGISDWDRFQRIIEYDREDFEFPTEKTDGFMIIEITMFQGRTRQQKQALIEKVTDNLVNDLSVEPTDVFIVIQDPPNENWGMGGKQRI